MLKFISRFNRRRRPSILKSHWHVCAKRGWWRKRGVCKRGVTQTGCVRHPALASAPDFIPYLAGVPCLDLQYTSQNAEYLFYPTYHTPYDTHHWVSLVDPHFKIHLAQAQLVARLVFNLTESHLLPFNLNFLSSSLEEILRRTRWYYDEKLEEHNITLEYISDEATKLGKTIKEFEKRKNQVKTGQKYERDIRMLNRRMIGINKMFLTPEDVPRRPGLKNVLHGISDNMFYPNITLVAISNAVIDAQKSGSWEDVKHQVSMTHHCIKQARDALQMPLELHTPLA